MPCLYPLWWAEGHSHTHHQWSLLKRLPHCRGCHCSPKVTKPWQTLPLRVGLPWVTQILSSLWPGTAAFPTKTPPTHTGKSLAQWVAMPISAEEHCWRWRWEREIPRLQGIWRRTRDIVDLQHCWEAPLLLGSSGTQQDESLHAKSVWDCLNHRWGHRSVHPEMARKAPYLLTQQLAGWWCQDREQSPRCSSQLHLPHWSFAEPQRIPLRWLQKPRADYSDKPRWGKLWYHQKGCKALSHEGERWEGCELYLSGPTVEQFAESAQLTDSSLWAAPLIALLCEGALVTFYWRKGKESKAVCCQEKRCHSL